VPAVVRSLPGMLARRGHMVMVGSPRGESGDMTPFLNHFHLWQTHGDLTLTGAHEWKIPPYPTPFVKHSMARNLGILCRLMIEEKLLLKPLTQVFRPSHAAEAYQKLEAEKNTTLGVVFDWTN
jgi:threonine dehydrogenase-like Zn-dependent dehydrogenase